MGRIARVAVASAVVKLTVHHTATRNDDPDPAATVRAIYRYHAVDRGWGDIGYHYLIDEAGRVYEGRWSGTDGDPAHDAAGNMVTAAHDRGDYKRASERPLAHGEDLIFSYRGSAAFRASSRCRGR